MKKKYIVIATFLAIFAFAPIAFAQEEEKQMEEGTVMAGNGSMTMENTMGPVVADRMLHAWVSLAAAIVIFIIALKYMAGGQLAKPVMLMGVGALGDSLSGLIPPPEIHMQWMWLGSLIFSTSVVLAILWMGKIFGVFARKQ